MRSDQAAQGAEAAGQDGVTIGRAYQSFGTAVDDCDEQSRHGEPSTRVFDVPVADLDQAETLGNEHAGDTDRRLDGKD